jgi:hypothetical protein
VEDGDHLMNEGADPDGRYPGRDASPNVAGAAIAGEEVAGEMTPQVSPHAPPLTKRGVTV